MNEVQEALSKEMIDEYKNITDTEWYNNVKKWLIVDQELIPIKHEKNCPYTEDHEDPNLLVIEKSCCADVSQVLVMPEEFYKSPDKYLKLVEFLSNHGCAEVVLKKIHEEKYHWLSDLIAWIFKKKRSQHITNRAELILSKKIEFDAGEYDRLLQYLKENNIDIDMPIVVGEDWQ